MTARCTRSGANIGLPIGPNGFVNLTAEYRDRNPTNRAGYDLRPNYNRPTAAFDPRELTFDRLEFRYGDAKTEDYNFFVNAGLPVGGGWELYGFGSYGHRDGLSAANYRNQNAAANRDFGALAPGQTPTAANFVPLTPDGFLPFIDTELEDYAGTVGLRGEVAGWNADLSLGYGQTASTIRCGTASTPRSAPPARTTFDAGGLRYGQIVANLDFSREYRDRPRQAALGRGRRRISQREFRRSGRASSSPSPPGRCSAPRSRPRRPNCAAAAGRLQCRHRHLQLPRPRRAGRRPGLPGHPGRQRDRRRPAQLRRLCRARHQSVRGLHRRPRRPLRAFLRFRRHAERQARRCATSRCSGYALRGSISNGFRAPSLHQQFFTTTSTNFINGFPVDIARSRSTARSRARSARATSSRKSRST